MIPNGGGGGLTTVDGEFLVVVISRIARVTHPHPHVVRAGRRRRRAVDPQVAVGIDFMLNPRRPKLSLRCSRPASPGYGWPYA